MRRAAAVATAICLGLTLSGPVAADEPTAGERRAPARKTVTLDFGDVVRQSHPDQRVRVRFRGRRGQQVRLASGLGAEPRDGGFVLRIHRRSIEPNRAGYVRLRRSGWQRLIYRPTAESASPQRLRLTRLRVRDLTVDGGTRHVVQRRGVEVAFRVTVPADALATVRRTDGSGFPMRAVLTPTGPLLHKSADDYFGPPFFLHAGSPLSDTYGVWGGEPLGAGDRVVLFPRRSASWQASTPSPHEVSLDESPVEIDGTGDPGRSHQLELSGEQGQWVRLQTAGDDAWLKGAHLGLHAVDGTMTRSTIPRLWRLPDTGTYRLVVTPAATAQGSAVQMSLSSVRELPLIRGDGTPATFATAHPGEMLVLPLDLSGHDRYELTADDVDMSGGWALTAIAQRGVYCGRPPGPNGCWDFIAGLGNSYLTSPLWAGDTSYVAVLMPAPETTGTLRLRVTPTS